MAEWQTGSLCGVCKTQNKNPMLNCIQCNIIFCEKCIFVHDRIPICKDHATKQVLPPSVSEVLSTDGDGDNTISACRLILIKQFNTKIDTDEDTPEIKSLLVLESGIILVADWKNCSLKAFNLEGKSLGHHYFSPADPSTAGRIHGLTYVDDKTVFATLPSLRKIALIKIVRDGDLVNFATTLHSTKRRYFGIAALTGKKQLIVGTTNTVDVLSYKGQLIRNVQYTFNTPYNMTSSLNSGCVYMTDAKENALFKVFGDNFCVQKFQVDGPFLKMRNITYDGEGNLFYCAEENSHGIEWVTTDPFESMGCVVDNDEDADVARVGLDMRIVDQQKLMVVGKVDGVIKVYRMECV